LDCCGSLAPVPRGEGWGEGRTGKLRNSPNHPGPLPRVQGRRSNAAGRHERVPRLVVFAGFPPAGGLRRRAATMKRPPVGMAPPSAGGFQPGDAMGKVFLSAVSSEFRTARQAIAKDLLKRRQTVNEQDIDFRKEAAADTLLAKLHLYISECSAVICLVGKRSGAFPPPAAAEPFEDFLPPGMTRASYTQWEFIFARHYRRRLSTLLADAQKYRPDEDQPSSEDEDADSQAAFIRYIQSLGVEYTLFSTAEEARIAILHEDWVRELPIKPNTLPYPTLGSLFKGREDFMRTLRQSLRRTAADGRAAAITGRALHGLGGVGKTRLAVEYAWLHEQDYNALLFVSGDTPQTLASNIAQLVGPLAIDLPADTPQDAAVAAALRWLEQNPGWFLIIDNLDTAEAVLAAEGMLARLTCCMSPTPRRICWKRRSRPKASAARRPATRPTPPRWPRNSAASPWPWNRRRRTSTNAASVWLTTSANGVRTSRRCRRITIRCRRRIRTAWP